MINAFSNTSYLLPPLLVGSVAIVLVVLVWQKSRRDISSRIFSFLVLSVALWSLLIFGMRSSPDTHHALAWTRAAIVPGFAIWVFFYHFTLAYTNLRRHRAILPAAYSLLLLVTVLAPTDLLVQDMRLEYYGYAPTTNPLSFPLFATTFPLLIAGAYNLVTWYRSSCSYEERNRVLYLLIGVPFLLLGIVLDGFTNLPPAGMWTNLIFCVICSIAILKYHLLDIRIIVRKGLVYLLLSVTVAIPCKHIVLTESNS